MRITGVGLVLALAIGACLVGCSEAGPEVISARGTVTYQGKPFEGARVMFHPEKGARPAHATTDAQGRFTLSTFGLNDGALPGKHKVTVTKVEMPTEAKNIDVQALQEGGYTGGGMPGYEAMMGVGGKRPPDVRSELPEKYGKSETTPIELEIRPGETNDFPLNLE